MRVISFHVPPAERGRPTSGALVRAGDAQARPRRCERRRVRLAKRARHLRPIGLAQRAQFPRDPGPHVPRVDEGVLLLGTRGARP